MKLPEGVNLKNIRAKALLGVVKETPEWQIRFINRWYSKTFHTPLHIVDNLPFEDVLLAYWEEAFEAMEEPQIQEAIDEITETPEEAVIREAQQEEKRMGDDEFLRYVQNKAQGKPGTTKTDVSAAVATPEVPDKLPPNVSISFLDRNLLEEFGDLDQIPTKPKPG